MAHKIKWMTASEAWILAQRLAKRLGNIEKVAKAIDCSHTTIYRWGKKSKTQPDVRHTIALKELAVKEGLLKD